MTSTIAAVQIWISGLHLGQAEEGGQGLMEYALILSLVSIFALAAVTALGQSMITHLYTFMTSL